MDHTAPLRKQTPTESPGGLQKRTQLSVPVCFFPNGGRKTEFVQTMCFRSREQRRHHRHGQGPDGAWLWWAGSPWHAIQESLPDSHGPLLPGGGRGASRHRHDCGLSVLSGHLVCLRVNGLEGDHSDCAEDPPTPAVNIKGDPPLGWGLAWASGAEAPRKGGLGRRLDSPLCLSNWARRSPVLCQEALAPPCHFSLALLCMAPPGGSPGVGPRPLATHECSGPGSSTGG